MTNGLTAAAFVFGQPDLEIHQFPASGFTNIKGFRIPARMLSLKDLEIQFE